MHVSDTCLTDKSLLSMGYYNNSTALLSKVTYKSSLHNIKSKHERKKLWQATIIPVHSLQQSQIIQGDLTKCKTGELALHALSLVLLSVILLNTNNITTLTTSQYMYGQPHKPVRYLKKTIVLHGENVQ